MTYKDLTQVSGLNINGKRGRRLPLRRVFGCCAPSAKRRRYSHDSRRPECRKLVDRASFGTMAGLVQGRHGFAEFIRRMPHVASKIYPARVSANYQFINRAKPNSSGRRNACTCPRRNECRQMERRWHCANRKRWHVSEHDGPAAFLFRNLNAIQFIAATRHADYRRFLTIDWRANGNP